MKHAGITRASTNKLVCFGERRFDRLRTAHGKTVARSGPARTKTRSTSSGASPNLLPLRGVHRGALREISRCSHTRAVVHSRTTVAGEIPRTSEVSSMVRPAKKRNSTIRLCWGSSLARS